MQIFLLLRFYLFRELFNFTSMNWLILTSIKESIVTIVSTQILIDFRCLVGQCLCQYIELNEYQNIRKTARECLKYPKSISLVVIQRTLFEMETHFTI